MEQVLRLGNPEFGGAGDGMGGAKWSAFTCLFKLCVGELTAALPQLSLWQIYLNAKLVHN